MQALNKERIRRWLPWLAVPAALVFLVTPSLILPGLAAGWAEEPTNREQGPPGKTSYDQVAPVLLGQKPSRPDGQGQGRQAVGHGPPEETSGGAL